ncbi:MAG: hypothetical protein FWE18_05855 [Alphaproteobacteria bacterium]|nr:hypothetical protein [Alphaproteobacteria bacterium]
MFKNTTDIKKFILEEDILYLEIRSITNKNTKSVVFTAKYLLNNLDSFFSENFNDSNISIKNIDISSGFLEVFLAHKTLVFFAQSLDLLESSTNANKYSFNILNDNNENPLAAPHEDIYRDFMGEISSSLLDIGEKPAYFYKDSHFFRSLVLQESSIYSKEKLKYAISMVAKAYNIGIKLI